MAYDKEVQRAAQEELLRRRQTAQARASAQLDRFLESCPRAEEIRREMGRSGAAAARAVLAGGDVRAQLERLKEQGLALNREYARLLAGQGLTRRDVEPQYTCSACQDTGFVDGRMCECHKRLRRQIAYRRLSEDLPLAACRFETFSLDYQRGDPQALRQMEKVLQACKEYAQRLRPHSPSLLFFGRTGLGKTHLSLAIANCAVEKGFGVVYGTVQGFTTAFEKERFEREEGTADALKECDLLILDDLGAEGGAGYVNAVLYDVLNSRMMGERPTIISTNLNLKELEKRYGERFGSRVGGYYAKMEFKGQDVRVLRRTGGGREREKESGSA